MNSLSKSSTGILLTNLGTPAAPTAKAVRKYLAEFLWDPYVVQISRPLWWLLLNCIILPIRSPKSAKLYENIWMEEGSPLLAYSSRLGSTLQAIMVNKGHNFAYSLGMRYGKPSLKEALISLKNKGVQKVILFPLYPQYSKVTTASTIDKVNQELLALKWQPELEMIEHYYDHPAYINAVAHSIQAHWQKRQQGEKLLFSFHGIPQKNIRNGDPYYDQCVHTAERIAEALNLNPASWKVVFQSRFGKEKWLEPYCIDVLKQLPNEGYKHIDVICPGFSVDCLETLEEISITNRKLFNEAGGLNFEYIPALNDSPVHAECLSTILLEFTEKRQTTSSR